MQLDYDAIAFLKLIPPVNIVAVPKANIFNNPETYQQFFPLLDRYSPQPIPRRIYWPTDTAAGLQPGGPGVCCTSGDNWKLFSDRIICFRTPEGKGRVLPPRQVLIKERKAAMPQVVWRSFSI